MSGLGFGKKNPYIEDDEEPHMISHNLDNDYEGGQWVDGEFFYTREREKHVQTRDEQIYGVFGDEDAYERERDKWKRAGGRSLLGQGVAFVSSGVVTPGSEDKQQQPAAASQQQEASSSSSAAESSSSSSSSGALPRSRPTFRGKHSGVSDVGDGRKAYFGDAEEAEERTPAAGPARAPQKKPSAPVKLDKDFAKFEKHSKGFGLKMLMKMGFKGRLGKNEQGIANPVAVTVRPKNMGMGFGDFKENARSDERERVFKPSPEEEARKAEEEREKAEREAAWRKDLPPEKRKVKRVYKTAAELMAEQQAASAAAAAGPQVIVDMRGPHVKVTSVDKVSTATQQWTPTQAAAKSALPELQHNVKLLVELTEADIHRYDREVRHANERLVALSRERDEMEGALLREEAAMERTQEVMRLIDATQEKLNHLAAALVRSKTSSAPSPGTPAALATAAIVERDMASAFERLDIVADVLDTVQHKYPEEYRRHGLVSLAIALAFPLFKTLMHGWEPLAVRAQPLPGTEPAIQRHKKVIAALTRWRLLLSGEMEQGQQGQPQADVWIRLLHEHVVPKLRFVLTTAWQTRDYEPAIALLDSLRPVLPEDMYGKVLSQLIVPRIKHEVNVWNPRQDPVPIHAWIHPWLTLLSDEVLQPLYAQIRYKLAFVLQEWHWSDSSARSIIEPWRAVWTDADMQAFLARSILPKLHWGMRHEFAVNPQQQVIAPFREALAWTGLIPAERMVALLLHEFFPKWLQALYTWLSTGNADLEQVAKWYAGWKGILPQPLLEAPPVKAMLASGLAIMQAAMEGEALAPAMQSAMATLNTLAAADAKALPAAQPQKLRKTPGEYKLSEADEDDEGLSLTGASFKEAVQKLAEMNNLEFAPNVKRGMHDGKQIYNFGRLSIYLHNQNMYAWLPSMSAGGSLEWRPISLRDALERARG